MNRVFGRKLLTLALALTLTLFAGCGETASALERAMTFRAKLLAAAGCTFDAEVIADYGDKSHSFSLSCQADENGNLTFTVTAPETLAGITGTVSASGGELTFQDKALAFDLLADGQISPVSGPWLLLTTLRSGYLTSCGGSGEGLRLSIDDSYREDALSMEILTDGTDQPTQADIVWQGRRIVSLRIKNFTLL